MYCIFFNLVNCYTINTSFYFLENSECEYNSSLCCFTVSDVHLFKAWLILVTLPCSSIVKSDFRILSGLQENIIKVISQLADRYVCYCSSFIDMNYRRDFLLMKGRTGEG